jgi:hypothetical protein
MNDAPGTTDPDPATLPPVRLTPDQLFARRLRLSGAWLLLSAYEGVPIYLAFMKLSGNPSREVGFFLALAMCWVPVVGTAAAIMACVFAGFLPWWLAATAFVVPKVLFMWWARGAEKRLERLGKR